MGAATGWRGSSTTVRTTKFAMVDLVIDLTDSSGSQVGGVSGSVEKIPAKSDKPFQFPIKQKDAVFALVRDISSR